MRGIGFALAAALAVATPALPAQAKTYALVIGVDDYAHVPSLAGAVNDARDLAATLQGRGAEVTLLLDKAASRERILAEWEAIARRIGPGDSIVFTYAGHGVQMPEELPGDESDGLDEVFILHGFDVEGPGLAERIRDNDISAMLQQIPGEVPVLLVADSCHSGTMTRSVDPRGDLGRSRYVPLGPITVADPLPPPPSRTRSIDATDFANVVFAHAARDEEQTPEVQIEGSYRGALSWSIARALEGQVRGHGGQSLGDFRDYVVEQVRALSGARQTPGVRFQRSLEGATAGQGLAALVAPATVPPIPGPAPADELRLAAPPTLFVREPAETRAVFLGEVELVSSEETARLLWDRARGELVDRATADVIAEARVAADVARAVLKWRAVQPLLRWAPKRPLEFRLDPDDRRYRLDDRLYISVTQPAPEFRYLTIVNLASTGEVQLVFPAPEHVSGDRDQFAPGETTRRLGPAPVTVPTGADHVIALASRQRQDALHAALDRLHGTEAPEELLGLLATHAADPERVRVGVLPIFTER